MQSLSRMTNFLHQILGLSQKAVTFFGNMSEFHAFLNNPYLLTRHIFLLKTFFSLNGFWFAVALLLLLLVVCCDHPSYSISVLAAPHRPRPSLGWWVPPSGLSPALLWVRGVRNSFSGKRWEGRSQVPVPVQSVLLLGPKHEFIFLLRLRFFLKAGTVDILVL